MNSQKLLIISVIAALLILGGAVAFVKLRSTAPTGTPSGTQSDHVVVDEIMASCTSKDQCIVVDTKCSFCCDYVAINAKSETLYNQMFDQTCKNYSGKYCECHDLTSYPSCVNGQCQMVKWTENKPLKTPPAPVAAPQPVVVTPAPVAAPLDAPIDPKRTTPAPAPVTTPSAPVSSPADDIEPAHEAFGEEEAAPAQPSIPASDDLYAPLPDDYKPELPPEDDGVDVIQP